MGMNREEIPNPDERKRMKEQPHTSSGLDLSIIVPCYNEEESLPHLWTAIDEVMRPLGRTYELLLVNDGSTDRTAAVMRELQGKDASIRVIQLRNNAGLSSALKAGFESARGDILITLDADLQNDPADIPMLLEYLPEYDMVFGWRQKRHDRVVKVLSTRIANAVRNWITKDDIPDIACTLKAFKRSCVSTIKMYKGMHRFLPTLFKIEGYKTIQVPVRHHHRKYGTAKYGVLNRIFVALIDCLAVRWMITRNIAYEKEEMYLDRD
ncbi:glycosyltransferase [bacterium]|nr:glycosyltransferase [bacterium]